MFPESHLLSYAMREINPVQALTYFIFKIRFNIILKYILCHQIAVFRGGVSTKILYAFLVLLIALSSSYFDVMSLTVFYDVSK